MLVIIFKIKGVLETKGNIGFKNNSNSFTKVYREREYRIHLKKLVPKKKGQEI